MRSNGTFLGAVGVLAVFLCGALPATGRNKKGRLRVPEVVETKEDRFLKLALKEDADAVGYLLRAFEPEAGRKYGLLVSLHGHGGEPKSLTFPGISKELEFFVLGVQGHTRTGPGFAWSDNDKKYVAGLALYVMDKHPVDRKKVLMTGHSAGGTMTLSTYKFAPHLFSGIMTTAAPATPDGGHNNVRTVVFLGDKDPNFAGAPGVRNNFSSKRRKAPGSFRIVTGLGHKLPDRFYVKQAVQWLLHPKARGWEVRLPVAPPVRDGKPYAHILVRYRGASGAGERARMTSKSRAKGEVKMIKKFLDRKLAEFFMEAAKHSHDDATAPSGGLIDGEGLAAFSPDLEGEAKKLEMGKCSDVLETPHGFHIIVRLTPRGEDE
ncbi:MAG: peptidylprolyl isomerase [Planctomycetota bacterium]|jgi:pimeloyl-ACP methyl ester carboxylesterase